MGQHRHHHHHQHHHHLLHSHHPPHLHHLHHRHHRHHHLHCAHPYYHAATTWTGSESGCGPTRRRIADLPTMIGVIDRRLQSNKYIPLHPLGVATNIKKNIERN